MVKMDDGRWSWMEVEVEVMMMMMMRWVEEEVE